MTDIRQAVDNLSSERKRLLRNRLLPLAEKDLMQASGVRLVAIVVAAGGRPVDPDKLRAHCNDKLPPYMVPQFFAGIATMPKTPAGKIDRQTLGRQNWSAAPAPAAGRDRPVTQVERKLSEIWADVLGFDEISVDDNFFEVGGDSLLSIRILAKAAREGLNIKPQDFFAKPTIAEQAAFLEASPIPHHEGQAPVEVAKSAKSGNQLATSLSAEDIAQVARLLVDIDGADVAND